MTEVVINNTEKKSQEFTYKIGDWFENKYAGETYVLVQVEALKVCLVGMDGNRYVDPVKVSDFSCITREEFITICGGFYTRFTKLSKVTITVE